MMGLTPEQLDALGGNLLGTCKSIPAGIESIGLNSDNYDSAEVEDELIGLNIELCQGCGWWHETCELVGEDDGNVGYCDDCRTGKADE